MGADPPSGANSSIVAIYVATERKIYLPEGWTGRTPGDSSILVHEMVHHLQNIAGTRYLCPQEREKLAYEAQERWLNSMGRTLEGELQLDGFSRFLLTQCIN